MPRPSRSRQRCPCSTSARPARAHRDRLPRGARRAPARAAAGTLRHAYDNVPHYRRSFDAAGVHPEDCRSLEDLATFPFTTKQDLRENYAFGMFAVPREQVSRVHASSGTTGRPTVVGYTKNDIDTWSSLMARSIGAAGGRPGAGSIERSMGKMRRIVDRRPH